MSARAPGQRWREAWRERWLAWVMRRIPPARELTLSQKNVFIMPSGGGFAFLLLLFALLIAGINYENNLVLALSFLLGGMFVVTILHSYANLAGLQLGAGAPRAVFAGERAAFALTLRASAKRCHDSIEILCSGAAPVHARIAPAAEDLQTVFLEAPRRGWLRPGRLRVRSYYPLGLVRVWSWVDLDVACLVYPRPASEGPLPRDSGHGDDGHATPDPGAEDFSGFRDYRPGDPLRRVAWKTLAKGQRLQTREYLAFADRRRWLAWEQTEGCGGVEERLSLLCRWVLELHRLKAEFGLLLPGLRLEPASGEVHRDRALAALALHGIAPA